MALEIRMLASGDHPLLARVAPDVFDNPVDEELAAEFLADPRHHLAVASTGGWVVGMASAVHYVHPDKPPELWISEVGVSPEHRGAGIAQRLLGALFELGADLGCTQAWVLADESNEVARHLYERAGGIAAKEPAIMYEFDLRTRNP